MAQNDPQPIDDDLNPGTYGFGDAKPVKRAAPPIRISKYDHSEPEEKESARRRRQREEDEEEARTDNGNDPFKSREDIKDPFEPFLQPKQWWFWSVVLVICGLLGLGVAATIAGLNVDPRVGAVGFVISLIVVIIETIGMAFVLTFVGIAFGIDYGPVKEALVKLGACVAFINGITLMCGTMFVVGFGPIAAFMPLSCIPFLIYAVISQQFELSMFESIVTVLAIEFCAWVMGTGLAIVLLRHMINKA